MYLKSNQKYKDEYFFGMNTSLVIGLLELFRMLLMYWRVLHSFHSIERLLKRIHLIFLVCQNLLLKFSFFFWNFNQKFTQLRIEFQVLPEIYPIMIFWIIHFWNTCKKSISLYLFPIFPLFYVQLFPNFWYVSDSSILYTRRIIRFGKICLRIEVNYVFIQKFQYFVIHFELFCTNNRFQRYSFVHCFPIH